MVAKIVLWVITVLGVGLFTTAFVANCVEEKRYNTPSKRYVLKTVAVIVLGSVVILCIGVFGQYLLNRLAGNKVQTILCKDGTEYHDVDNSCYDMYISKGDGFYVVVNGDYHTSVKLNDIKEIKRFDGTVEKWN